MSALLGITYPFCKVLPIIFQKRLITPSMSSQHLGTKLKAEATRMGLKPWQIAEMFDVKPPSVYDWCAHGRIHKKHYAKLVEFSGRDIGWWLDFPEPHRHVSQDQAAYEPADSRHVRLIELFDSLPGKDKSEVLAALESKKHHYDAIIDELLTRRQSTKSPQ